eukprot:TRINITY_DN5950_c0_g1_i3.p1 TRINITY_DN5950_c0_g1~~TRINITY_DN5950_c0_g1_i3.p1  ORF type:complete len:222 (-),score=4.70 TRINITY_DN5950_c0_g1_i3:191-772(-)
MLVLRTYFSSNRFICSFSVAEKNSSISSGDGIYPAFGFRRETPAVDSRSHGSDRRLLEGVASLVMEIAKYQEKTRIDRENRKVRFISLPVSAFEFDAFKTRKIFFGSEPFLDEIARSAAGAARGRDRIVRFFRRLSSRTAGAAGLCGSGAFPFSGEGWRACAVGDGGGVVEDCDVSGVCAFCHVFSHSALGIP